MSARKRSPQDFRSVVRDCRSPSSTGDWSSSSRLKSDRDSAVWRDSHSPFQRFSRCGSWSPGFSLVLGLCLLLGVHIRIDRRNIRLLNSPMVSFTFENLRLSSGFFGRA